MKKILLISDTHGHFEEKLLKYIEEADEVWHAGDIGVPDVCERISELRTLRSVHGNIDSSDSRSTHPENNIFLCEKVKVLITHIAGPFAKYNSRVKELISQHEPMLLVCGHSHILKVAYDKKHQVLYMNPGACGVHGFHKVRTALRFVIDGEKIDNLDVIEFGTRTLKDK